MSYPGTVDAGGVPPWIVDGGTQLAGNANAALSANTVYLWAFELSDSTTLGGMRWRMAATATGKTDAGIYDASGTLLASIGATANSANVDNTAAFSAGNITLAKGRYLLALTPGNGTDTYERASNLQVAASNIITRALTATNTSTGTTTPALPPTTGTFVIATLTPTISAYVVGGLA